MVKNEFNKFDEERFLKTQTITNVTKLIDFFIFTSTEEKEITCARGKQKVLPNNS